MLADEKLSHYKIINKIGAGGMGEIYLAEDTRLNRKVALKFLSAKFVNETERLSRFVQEAKTASQRFEELLKNSIFRSKFQCSFLMFSHR